MPRWHIGKPACESLNTCDVLVSRDRAGLPPSYRADLLTRVGYNDYQIYLLLSCAPVQGHIAGIVDIPNACTTMGVPIDIFDFDISPSAKVEKRELGNCAFAS